LGATSGTNPFIPYGLTVALGFAALFPTGPYNSANIVNPGAGLFVMTPNIALTYNTGPNWSIGDSTQISARFFFAFPLENSTTHYQSGDVMDIDWAATQVFGPWQVGVQGYFQTQYTNDIKLGGIVPLYGNRYEAAGLGPVVQYNFPDGAFLKAKWTGSILSKNTLEENTFVVVFGMKLL
jgi:hypothetical protein